MTAPREEKISEESSTEEEDELEPLLSEEEEKRFFEEVLERCVNKLEVEMECSTEGMNVIWEDRGGLTDEETEKDEYVCEGYIISLETENIPNDDDNDDDGDGVDGNAEVKEDKEEVVAIDRKRMKDSALALEKLGKNEPGAKSKKRPRVLAEDEEETETDDYVCEGYIDDSLETEDCPDDDDDDNDDDVDGDDDDGNG